MPFLADLLVTNDLYLVCFTWDDNNNNDNNIVLLLIKKICLVDLGFLLVLAAIAALVLPAIFVRPLAIVHLPTRKTRGLVILVYKKLV